MVRRCGFRWLPRLTIVCGWGAPIRRHVDPHEGLSAFLVELDRPGVTTGDIHGKLGVRAGSTGWIAFQDVRVPAANRIGEEGEGFQDRHELPG